MALSLVRRKSYFVTLVGFLVLTLLTACDGGTSATSPSSPSNSTSTTHPTANSASTATALKNLMTLVGEPKAKMLAGTAFEVDGMVKNGDSKQHDIFLEATLFDASGQKIATTTVKNVDEVAAGTTVPYALPGTTPQPTWATVGVTIIKVTENIDGSGTD